MNQEQVIEIGQKHTTIETRGDVWFSLPVWALANLIAEVEQATLERAAEICALRAKELNDEADKHYSAGIYDAVMPLRGMAWHLQICCDKIIFAKDTK